MVKSIRKLIFTAIFRGVFVKSVNNGAALSDFEVMAVDQRFKVSQVLSI